MKFISEQVREWTDEEKGRVNHIINALSGNIERQGYKLSFPDTVFMIKTNAKEESGAAGYTRANYIVLKDNIMNIPYNRLRKTVAHELFHVLSRNDSLLRRRLYDAIGFTVCNEVMYPPELKAYRMSNPDAPDQRRLHQTGSRGRFCGMYDDTLFKPTLQRRFIFRLSQSWISPRHRIEDPDKQIVYENDKAVIYSIDEVSGVL